MPTKKSLTCTNCVTLIKSFTILIILHFIAMYEVWSKNNCYFQISWVTCVQFSHFFSSVMLVRLSIIYVVNISHSGLSVCFWQTKKVSRVLVCSSIFYYSKKWIKETLSSFVLKNKIKCTRTFKMLTVAFGESIMSIEHKFNCGITGLKKAQKMLKTMLVLVARAREQAMKTLKLWRKWFWIFVESLLERLLVRLMPSNFYGCFRHEIYGSEHRSKITKFWAKPTSHGHRSGDVDDVQRWSRFAKKKGHNWWRIMSVWLWRPNGSVQGRAETGKSTSSSIKCESFVYCFLRLQWRGASWIFATKSYGQ